ncbi:MAG: PorV/PorQ family protein [Bacteroidota bacterium]|nr:PorV/PorQ family protein [Bacteroidota bacterium]MDP4232781.1 PorV/PorQ family protein [Bacteroidota bacterium]MDP4242537.1 PorV/PorQ family protein [Bacteroidota bacterium]MDP4288884.1 PorV/PorQ family protein [Bacteroidota bacterium]
MSRRNMMRAVALLCGFLAVSNLAFGQGASTTGTTSANFTNVGASGSVFTKIWVGARASGMAGAYSGLADDISSLYWNPAGIARLPGINVEATHTIWFADISHEFIGMSMPISDRYRLGAALTLVDYGSLAYSTIQNDANAGTFNANDLSFALTLAGALTDRFSYGATVKYLRSAILDMAADGFAFDAGSLYQTDFYHMRISMDLANLGSDRNFTGNSLSVLINNGSGVNQKSTPLSSDLRTANFALPLIFRIGAATDIFQGNVENQKLNVDFDFSTHSDGPEQFNLGGEYIYNDMAAFRLGYAFNQDQLGLGAGAGYHYKSEDFSGTVDYSINLTRALGSIHRISLSATFQ